MKEILKVDEWLDKSSPKFKLIREFSIQRLKDSKRFTIDDLVMIDGDYDYFQLIGFSKNNRDVFLLSSANQFEMQVDVDHIFHIHQNKNIAFSD
jgi:hypothetical protein